MACHCLWVLVWAGACYWNGVGGFMFDSSSSSSSSSTTSTPDLRRHMTPPHQRFFSPPGFSRTMRPGQSATLRAPKGDRVSHGASFLTPGSLARRRPARVIHHHLHRSARAGLGCHPPPRTTPPPPLAPRAPCALPLTRPPHDEAACVSQTSARRRTDTDFGVCPHTHARRWCCV